jgi:hypothetical protein
METDEQAKRQALTAALAGKAAIDGQQASIVQPLPSGNGSRAQRRLRTRTPWEPS